MAMAALIAPHPEMPSANPNKGPKDRCISKKHSTMKNHPLRRLAYLTIRLLGILFSCSSGAVPTLKLDISPPSAANEFSRGASIVWDGESDLRYKIQSATTLGDAS